MTLDIVSTILGVILSAFTLASIAIKPVKHLIEQSKAFERALCILLAKQIDDACFAAEQAGEISPQQRADIANTYEAYKALGGDGYRTQITKQALSLPCKKEN